LKEHAGPAAEIAASPGAVPALRVQACRVLGQFGGEAATRALLSVLTSRADPPVRAAAAEALADLGDRAVRPVLEALLDEEVPRPVWTAVSAAVDRLR
jgi:HEAT repeat protein